VIAAFFMPVPGSVIANCIVISDGQLLTQKAMFIAPHRCGARENFLHCNLTTGLATGSPVIHQVAGPVIRERYWI
jgi:hypothetical protein